MCVVIHADLRALGYCNRGARVWFKRNGLDWSEFLKEGIGSECLLLTGDTMAEDAVKVARERVQRKEQHGRQ